MVFDMSYFNEIFGALMMVVGVFFILLAGVGLLRMPDMFLRMSTATKASTLGLGLIVLLTAPVSAHMIGRAAYSDGVPLWKKTKQDDLKTYYETHRLVVPDETKVEPESPPSTSQA
jgi:multicomponent Na+:H+ antiporter subunit G